MWFSFRLRYAAEENLRRGAGKAFIALAQKFLGILYHLLKNKWRFEDFPSLVLA